MGDSGEDPISLSFVDCMSCGLAAALFMFLIFAAIPRAAAIVDAQFDNAAGVTAKGGDNASALPPLFDGSGTNVPVDIRIVFDGDGLPVGYGAWSKVRDTDSVFRLHSDRETVFLTMANALELAPPAFAIETIEALEGVGGTITIKAGGDTASFRFDCSPLAANSNVTVMTFESGKLMSECRL